MIAPLIRAEEHRCVSAGLLARLETKLCEDLFQLFTTSGRHLFSGSQVTASESMVSTVASQGREGDMLTWALRVAN